MVFWRKKKQPPVVSCYGKLPATGDFVRLNATGAENAAFDNWLGGSVHTAREALGSAFDACYQPAAGVFVFRGADGDDGDEPDRGMVGVWASSGDSAGRKYPMVVATCYDYEELLAVGPALPIAIWPFLASAYELVVGGRGDPVDTFLNRVAQLQPIPLDNPESSAAGYQRWLQTQTMKALWETTFGTVEHRHSVVQHVEATIEIFQGQERPQTALGLRFPTHAGDAYAAAVWADMTLRLTKLQQTVLNSFWTPQHDLLIHLGPPQLGTFREMICNGTDTEHVTDLLQIAHANEATARPKLPASVAAAVDDPNKTIHAFLQGLS